MGKKTCSESNCEKPHHSGGYCGTHYQHWKRHHSPIKCSVEDCDSGALSLGLCNRHYKRMRRHDDTDVHYPTVEHPKYRSMHCRVDRDRGSASTHSCIDCGKPASHWSYDHSDPDEYIDTETGCPLSTDVSRYHPRCTFCHRRYDMPRRPPVQRTARGTYMKTSNRIKR